RLLWCDCVGTGLPRNVWRVDAGRPSAHARDRYARRARSTEAGRAFSRDWQGIETRPDRFRARSVRRISGDAPCVEHALWRHADRSNDVRWRVVVAPARGLYCKLASGTARNENRSDGGAQIRMTDKTTGP